MEAGNDIWRKLKGLTSIDEKLAQYDGETRAKIVDIIEILLRGLPPSKRPPCGRPTRRP